MTDPCRRRLNPIASVTPVVIIGTRPPLGRKRGDPQPAPEIVLTDSRVPRGRHWREGVRQAGVGGPAGPVARAGPVTGVRMPRSALRRPPGQWGESAGARSRVGHSQLSQRGGTETVLHTSAGPVRGNRPGVCSLTDAGMHPVPGFPSSRVRALSERLGFLGVCRMKKSRPADPGSSPDLRQARCRRSSLRMPESGRVRRSHRFRASPGSMSPVMAQARYGRPRPALRAGPGAHRGVRFPFRRCLLTPGVGCGQGRVIRKALMMLFADSSCWLL